jgi:hypothetical protein
MEKEIGTEVILFRFDAVTYSLFFMGELHVFVKINFLPRQVAFKSITISE